MGVPDPSVFITAGEALILSKTRMAIAEEVKHTIAFVFGGLNVDFIGALGRAKVGQEMTTSSLRRGCQLA